MRLPRGLRLIMFRYRLSSFLTQKKNPVERNGSATLIFPTSACVRFLFEGEGEGACHHDVRLLPLCQMTASALPFFQEHESTDSQEPDGCTDGRSVAQPGQNPLHYSSSAPLSRNLLPISHVCTEDGEKPMVLLPFMAWGNLKLFLRQCKLAEANNPQVSRAAFRHADDTSAHLTAN